MESFNHGYTANRHIRNMPPITCRSQGAALPYHLGRVLVQVPAQSPRIKPARASAMLASGSVARVVAGHSATRALEKPIGQKFRYSIEPDPNIFQRLGRYGRRRGQWKWGVGSALKMRQIPMLVTDKYEPTPIEPANTKLNGAVIAIG